MHPAAAAGRASATYPYRDMSGPISSWDNDALDISFKSGQELQPRSRGLMGLFKADSIVGAVTGISGPGDLVVVSIDCE